MIDFKTGQTITLAGKTRKGNNRIAELGNKWTILEVNIRVLFSNELGPWLRIVPRNNREKMRWVHGDCDVDFVIAE